jgi:hypothetical protein
VPIGLRPQLMTARNSHFLHVVGRVRPAIGWSAVRDDMQEVARQLAREYPATNDRVGITVTPLKEEVTRDAGRALLLSVRSRGRGAPDRLRQRRQPAARAWIAKAP